MKTNIERILIVDDEETACFIIEDTVKSLGEIKTAQTKDEAINIAKWFKPDIILLDIYVGDENGFDIRKEIISFLPNVSIIYITTTADLALQAYENGGVDFITKPIDTQLAYNRVKNQLNISTSRRDLHIANQRFNNMLDSLDSAIILTDEYGKISQVNREASNLTGFTIAEMINADCDSLLNLSGNDKKEKKLTEDVLKDRDTSFNLNKYTLTNRTDKAITVSIQTKLVLDLHGGISGVLVIINQDEKEEQTKHLSCDEVQSRYRFLSDIIHKMDNDATLLVESFIIKNQSALLNMYGQEIIDCINDELIDELCELMPAMNVVGFVNQDMLLACSIRKMSDNIKPSSLNRVINYLGETIDLELGYSSTHYPTELGSIDEVVSRTFRIANR